MNNTFKNTIDDLSTTWDEMISLQQALTKKEAVQKKNFMTAGDTVCKHLQQTAKLAGIESETVWCNSYSTIKIELFFRLQSIELDSELKEKFDFTQNKERDGVITYEQWIALHILCAHIEQDDKYSFQCPKHKDSNGNRVIQSVILRTCSEYGFAVKHDDTNMYYFTVHLAKPEGFNKQ